ncbi:phage tail tip lysozyme [Acidisoma cladoniae]|uniref:phage tail tip lysozyme n=1 Tax=Acidisoma cladoniae TaxID=3040935 RepID=UPI00254BA9EA|nr:phage tail tip lysozyme [Acidisoma sp. PAMC 29798]
MAAPAIGVVITGKSDLDKVFAKTGKQIDLFRAQSQRSRQALDKMTDTRGIAGLTKGFQGASLASFDFLKNISRSVDAMGVLTGAGSIAGIVGLSDKFATFGQAQLNASRGINMNVKTLSTWQNAAAAAGSSAESATSSISGMEKAVTEMTNMGAPGMGYANQFLGAGWATRYKTDTDKFLAISKAVSGLQGDAKAKAMSELEGAFQISPDFMQDVLARGPAYVQKELDTASKHSMNDDQANKLDGLATSFSHLGSSVKDAGVAAATYLSPVLTPALNGLSDWIDNHQKAFGEFELGIGSLVGSLTSLKLLKMVLPKGAGAAPEAAAAEGAEAGAVATSPSLWSKLLPLGASVSDGALGAGAAAMIALWPETPGMDDLGLSRKKMTSMAGNAAYLSAAMKAQGAPPSFIAAALGNAAIESGLDPSKPQNGGGPGYGLFQWEAPRQTLFQKVEGIDIHKATMAQETDFFMREMKADYPSVYSQLMSGKLDTASATRLLMHDYLAPADKDNPTGSILYRTAAANEFASAAGDPTGGPYSGPHSRGHMSADAAQDDGGLSATAGAQAAAAQLRAGGDDGDSGVHTVNLNISGLPAGAKATARSSGAGRSMLKTVTAMPGSGAPHQGMYHSAIDGQWHDAR